MQEGKRSELTRLCWEETRKRSREGKVSSVWEEERRKFFENRDWDIKEGERRRTEREMWFEKLLRREKEIQREERSQKIREVRYCRWYVAIKIESIPEYLRKGWSENR